MVTILHESEQPKAAFEPEVDLNFEPRSQSASSSSKPTDDVRMAALLCALLIAGFAAIGIVMLALDGGPEGPTQISDCTAVSQASSRLACFDTLARRLEAEPSKGATAPALDSAP